jgi:hypothetical protein
MNQQLLKSGRLWLPLAFFACVPITQAQQAATACDRACMENYALSYAKALIKHDAAGLPLAANVKMSENGKPTTVGEGIWKTTKKFYSTPSNTQYVVDFKTNQVAMMGVIDVGVPAIFATRLKLDGGKISEIETLVKREADAGSPFWPEGVLWREAPYIRTIPAKLAMTRDALAKTADSYWTIATSTHTGLPYSGDCVHLENGMNTSWERPLASWEVANPKDNPPSDYDGRIWTCAREVQLTTRSWQKARLHRRLIDEERGLVLDWNLVDRDQSMQSRSVPIPTQNADGSPVTPPAWGPPSRGDDGWPKCNGPLCGTDSEVSSAAVMPAMGMGGEGMGGGMGPGGPMGGGQFGLNATQLTNYHAQLFRIVNGKIMREQVFWTAVPYQMAAPF